MKRVLMLMFVFAIISMIGATAGDGFSAADKNNSGTFTDNRDGHIYKWIKIGKQVWMAENLAYLPSVHSSSIEIETDIKYYVTGYCDGYKKGCNVAEAKTHPDYTTYGVLYDWEAAVKACPAGWHLPSDAEWKTLINYLGNDVVAGGKMKEAGNGLWEKVKDRKLDTSNASGFTALPGGMRSSSGGFFHRGLKAYFWSVSAEAAPQAHYWLLEHYHDQLSTGKISRNCGLYVRCIQN